MHDQFVRRYTRTRQARYMKTTRPVFVMTKGGFMRPAMMGLREVFTAATIARGEVRYVGTLQGVKTTCDHLLVRLG